MALLKYSSRDLWSPASPGYPGQCVFFLPGPTSCLLSLQGDSGGPLVCILDGYWYVVGLASWSGACLHPIHSPNIFTRVSYYSDWIKKTKEQTPDVDPSSAPLEEMASSLTGWGNFSAGTSLEPRICTTLLSSQALLLQSIWLKIL